MSTNGLLFPDEDLVAWKREWQNMPEYTHENLDFRYQVLVNFATKADVEDFARLIEQQIVVRARGRILQSVWFPDQERESVQHLRYAQKETLCP